ncbi:hypothetical protein DYB37_004745 [Aphanomyces astaci]|uniref:Uncharacterized protein n=1 Tax=Aphanomyces astaci TaxID=112090 RepID=A0A3R7B8T0_APHAT|nr:hypothetical protein DYB35_011700 [Aphanomyces astaci]RHZ21856.1 hypothetical protein DYB37_004745 [Aphanomyces astaci]
MSTGQRTKLPILGGKPTPLLLNEVAARHAGKGKGKSKVVPRKFPMLEKRLPPRKDFSSMYMVAQNETTQLQRE